MGLVGESLEPEAATRQLDSAIKQLKMARASLEKNPKALDVLSQSFVDQSDDGLALFSPDGTILLHEKMPIASGDQFILYEQEGMHAEPLPDNEEPLADGEGNAHASSYVGVFRTGEEIARVSTRLFKLDGLEKYIDVLSKSGDLDIDTRAAARIKKCALAVADALRENRIDIPRSESIISHDTFRAQAFYDRTGRQIGSLTLNLRVGSGALLVEKPYQIYELSGDSPLRKQAMQQLASLAEISGSLEKVLKFVTASELAERPLAARWRLAGIYNAMAAGYLADQPIILLCDNGGKLSKKAAVLHGAPVYEQSKAICNGVAAPERAYELNYVPSKLTFWATVKLRGGEMRGQFAISEKGRKLEFYSPDKGVIAADIDVY